MKLYAYNDNFLEAQFVDNKIRKEILRKDKVVKARQD